MAHILGGTPSATSFGIEETRLVVDATFGSARVTEKPDEYNFGVFTGGHYRLAVATGLVTGIAAASALFSVRWAQPVGFLVLRRIQAYSILTTAFTSAQQVDLDVIRVSGFTAPDTGGTALTPFTGNAQKARTIMATSQISDMRVATTAALGAGTRTLDPNAFATGVATPSAANTAFQTSGYFDLYSMPNSNVHPHMFGNNEGFLIRNVTAFGAAGVAKLYFTIEWAELPGL
jgi:hypothetical protein